jgi:mannose-6-phosphate isomerase-like protein (cupin superfamily)
MNTSTIPFVLVIFVAMTLTFTVGAIAQDVPGGSIVVTPSDLKWSESPRAPGVQTAALVGDPSKSAPYVFRAKYPSNTVNRPDHHPGDEEITVLSGTLYFGFGLAMEPEKTRTLPPGSFIAVPAKAWHFLSTRSEPVELEIRGTGPRANIFAK